MPRNPNWTRDELILALDLYFQVNPSVVALSDLLNELPVHSVRPSSFRNPNSVYMKLGNLLGLDSGSAGIGLNAGSQLDRKVWVGFAQDRSHLSRLAEAIRRIHRALPSLLILPDDDFPEGKILYTAHRLRETRASGRRPAISSKSAPSCDACGLSSEDRYRTQVVTVHDLIPPWELDDPLSPQPPLDLISVCANCHQALHLTRPWVGANELQGLVHSPGSTVTGDTPGNRGQTGDPNGPRSR